MNATVVVTMTKALCHFIIIALFTAVVVSPRGARAQVAPDDRPSSQQPVESPQAGTRPISEVELETETATVDGLEPEPEKLIAAPTSDDARGLTAQRPPSAWSHLRIVPRAILFVPRWTFVAVMWPVREGLFLVDRYDVLGRVSRLLSGDGPFTVFPSAVVVGGQGVTYGLGIGVKKYLRGRFLFGGEARQIYGLELRTRELLGSRLELDLEGEHQRLRNSIFAGIGNGELSRAAPPIGSALIDPTLDDAAFEARYNQQITRLELGGDFRPVDGLTVRFSGAYLRRRFGQPSDAEAISLTEVYDRMSVKTFDDGFSQLYGEARLTFDNRTQPSRWVSTALPTHGWKLTGFAGWAAALKNAHKDYAKLGVNVQRYHHLFGGDRVLIGRAQLGWVSAERGELPFVDLPSLGGSTILRGYRRGRFRDRTSALATAEYRFPIHRQLSGFLFLDGGTVAEKLSQLDANEIHFGAGQVFTFMALNDC